MIFLIFYVLGFILAYILGRWFFRKTFKETGFIPYNYMDVIFILIMSLFSWMFVVVISMFFFASIVLVFMSFISKRLSSKTPPKFL